MTIKIVIHEQPAGDDPDYRTESYCWIEVDGYRKEFWLCSFLDAEKHVLDWLKSDYNKRALDDDLPHLTGRSPK